MKFRWAMLAALFIGETLSADTLGFVELKFSDLHFEKGTWSRTAQTACFAYAALADGATLEVLRIGMANFISFKAKRGLTVTVCGSVAAFDEGFQAGIPAAGKAGEKQNP
jgi:hypothetical protein